MKCKHIFLFLIIPLFFSCTTSQPRETIRIKREVLKLTVNNKERTLLVYYPQESGPFPLLIAYHGHAGTASRMHEITMFEKRWPQAVIVYPQGLRTKDRKGGVDTGWEFNPDQNNNDLLLFDEIVDYFTSKGIIDQQRVYVTGQSMGGAFTFCLWLTKTDRIAAFAPCSCELEPKQAAHIPEKPFMMVSGKGDSTVPFAKQEKSYMLLKSKFSGNQKMVFYVHNGGHSLPSEAPSKIVAFFKEIDDGIIANR